MLIHVKLQPQGMKSVEMGAKSVWLVKVIYFQITQPLGWAISTNGLCVCLSVCLSIINFVPCDWSTRLNGVILPSLILVDAGLSSANWFYVGVGV